MQRATSLIGSVAGLLAGVGLLVVLLLGRSFLGERESFWVNLAGAFVAGAVVLFAVQCFGGLFRPSVPPPSDENDPGRELRHELSSLGRQLETLRGNYQSAVEDLAAQKATAETLRQVLQRADPPDPKSDGPLARAATASRNMVARVTGSLRWMNCTRALQKFLGLPLAEIVGRPFREFVHPDDWPGIERGFQEALAGGEEHNLVFRLRLPSPGAAAGDERHVQMDISTRYSDAGAAQYFRCFFVDVTARVRAEAELRRRTEELVESNKQLRQINQDLERLKESYRDLYHHAPVWYFSLDPEGRVVAVNETMLRALGYRRREVLNQPYANLLAPDAAAGQAAFQHADEAECRWVKKDGSVIAVWIRSVPVRDEEGRFVRTRSAAQDVTERNRLADELRRRTAELEKVNQDLQATNKELDHFNWTVAHDLKEPLRTLAATGGQLQRAFERHDYAECDGDLQRLVLTSLRLARLVDNLLTLSREGQPVQARTSFSLDEALATVRGDLADLIHRRQARVSLAGPAPTVRGDPERVMQLLANLVGNGLKYNTNPEPVVEVGAVATGNAEASEAEGMLTLFVRDNGVGIDPQFHQRIFEKFERLNPGGQSEGTGVGLTICKKIVEAHGGRIWVRSRAGQGATFYFTLPRGTPGPAGNNGAVPAPPEAEMAAPVAGRLLLVEDMDELGRVAQRLLEMAGHRVDWCQSAEQAWEHLQHARPDLVLLDINLPGMSGLDLCRRLRATPEQAGLRVALFSQADQESDVQTGMAAGADHVLSKELLCEPDRLGRQLRTILARPAPPAGDP